MNGTRETETGALLDHLIVLAEDRQESAEFVTWLLGLPPAEPQGIFLAVPLGNGVTLLFKKVEAGFPGQHYAFRVGAEEFAEILDRVRQAGIAFRGSPRGGQEQETYELDGDKGFYLYDPAGHQLEVLTEA